MNQLYLYTVSRSDFEEYTPHLLGHEREFDATFLKSLCDSLLYNASVRAVRKAQADMMFVGWREIVDELCEVLVEVCGFVRLKTVEVDYFGPGIIETDDEADNPNQTLKEPALGIVVEHNREAMRQQDERWANRPAGEGEL